MSKRTRRTHSPVLKAKVALAAYENAQARTRVSGAVVYGISGFLGRGHGGGRASRSITRALAWVGGRTLKRCCYISGADASNSCQARIQHRLHGEGEKPQIMPSAEMIDSPAGHGRACPGHDHPH